MTNKQIAERFVATLNELVELDNKAIRNLILNKVECNEAIADHPTVQVGLQCDGQYSIGALGLLNGLVGIQDDGWGYIAAVFGVWCSKCSNTKNKKVGEECPDCGTRLILGDLKGFELLDRS
jgi:hypothetical protein